MSKASSLLIFGGSRGTGLELARLMRREECSVHAVTRSHSVELEQLGVQQVSGDAEDAVRIAEICHQFRDVGAVVSTMGGGSSDGEGTITVINAVHKTGIRRFLLVSSLGAGESRAFASQRLLDAIGPILEEKTRAENYLKATALDFTIIRPGQLLNSPPTGRAALCEDPGVHGSIPRAELAMLIRDCLNTPETIGRTFSAVAS